MKNRKIKQLALSLSVVLACSVNTLATTSTLGVTRIQQEKTNWCWAASAEMVGRYKNSSTSYTQWDVVKQEKGSSYPNKGGTDTNIKNGIKLVGGSYVTPKLSSSPLSFSTIKTQINNKKPSVVHMTWKSSGGHAIVIAGYNDSNNSVYCLDPWESTSNAYYKHADLVNGTTIATGTGTYTSAIYLK